ncbi:COMM domain-containing protein 6 isoform X2 [Dendrobates tinctorius]|uniref:COMM domain-containing protein 6 isoform X2 n=1 Tax=Dendrobates tinctorius TaxID=92724 RepID=UPI003CC9B2D9
MSSRDFSRGVTGYMATREMYGLSEADYLLLPAAACAQRSHFLQLGAQESDPVQGRHPSPSLAKMAEDRTEEGRLPPAVWSRYRTGTLQHTRFEKSSDLMKLLPPDLFAELCQQCIQHLQCQSAGVDQTLLCQRFQAAGVDTNVDEVRNVINAVNYLFSNAAKHKLTTETLLNTVTSHYKLPKQTLQVIRHVWNEEGKKLCDIECSRDLLPAAQLLDFQWKIGMAISSDGCKSLNHPYVTVELKVAEHSGQVQNKVFEMTVPEFQHFSKQFKEMSAALENV